MVLSLSVIGAARSPAVWLIGMFTYLFVDVLVDISMNLQGSWISARRHAPVMNRLHGLWSLGTFAGGLGGGGGERCRAVDVHAPRHRRGRDGGRPRVRDA